MKLTNSIKHDILNSILADMPKPINYAEQIQTIVLEDSFSQLPIELQNAINSNKEIKNYLDFNSTRIADCGCMYLRSYAHYVASKDVTKKINDLHALNDAQDKKRREIKNNLWAIIDSCNTSKQFADNYPEFAEYIPAESQPMRNLPAVELITEMKKAGWGAKS